MGLLDTLQKKAKEAALVGTLAVAGVTGYAEENQNNTPTEVTPIVHQEKGAQKLAPVQLTEAQLNDWKKDFQKTMANPEYAREQNQEKDAFIAEYLPKQIQDLQHMGFDERNVAWRTMELEAGGDTELQGAIQRYAEEKAIQAGYDAVEKGKPKWANAVNGHNAVDVAYKILDVGNLKVNPNANLGERMKNAGLDRAAEYQEFTSNEKNNGKYFFEGERGKNYANYIKELQVVDQHLLDYDAGKEHGSIRQDEIVDYRKGFSKQMDLQQDRGGRPSGGAPLHVVFVDKEAHKNIEAGQKEQNIGINKMVAKFKADDKNQGFNPAVMSVVAANMSK